MRMKSEKQIGGTGSLTFNKLEVSPNPNYRNNCAEYLFEII